MGEEADGELPIGDGEKRETQRKGERFYSGLRTGREKNVEKERRCGEKGKEREKETEGEEECGCW